MPGGDAGSQVGHGNWLVAAVAAAVAVAARREEDLKLVEVRVPEELSDNGAAEAADETVVLVGPLI